MIHLRRQSKYLLQPRTSHNHDIQADVHPDGVCMLVERVLGEVMTLTPDGFLEEKMHAVTSRDVDLGKESPWDFSAALDEEGVGTCAAIPQATAGAVAAEP